MKRALHRSVWFWLGWFVLGFLVWVWWDSWRVRTEVSREWFLRSSVPGGFPVLGRYVDYVAVDGGMVWIYWNGVRITEGSMRAERHGVDFTREAVEPLEDEVWLAMPGASREVEEDVPGAMVRSTVVQVPLWMVTGMYVMMCGGVVWWRRRRWMRVDAEGMAG